MVNIEVVNLTSRNVSKKDITQTIKKIIKKLRQKEGFSFLKTVDLSIAFIGEAEIKKLNAKYRKINKPTDELSFLLAKTKNKLTGEILLCPKVIKTKDYGFQVSSFPGLAKAKPRAGKFQVNRLLTHAFLHLCGFDHETDKEWREMEEMEEILQDKLKGQNSKLKFTT